MQTKSKTNFTNHTNLEINIAAVATKFPLKENDTLRGKKVTSIDTFKVADVAVSPLIKALVNATVFNKSYLVLNISGEDRINRLPLAALCPTINNGKRFTFPGDGVVIDWAKSYIEVPSTAGMVADESYLFNVYYTDTTK